MSKLRNDVISLKMVCRVINVDVFFIDKLMVYFRGLLFVMYIFGIDWS